MNQDDDEIAAMANRLRQSGWMEKSSAEKQATKKRRPVAPPPTRMGSTDGKVTAVAHLLVKDFYGYSWPTFLSVSEAYNLTYYEAVAAALEAKRLTGDTA